MSKKKSREEPKSENKANTRNNIVSWAVFIPTLVVVFISLIPVVFPALIARSVSPIQDEVFKSDIINPFQIGTLAGPLIVLNIIILLIGIAYYKKSKGKGLFRSILRFELSQKRALIILGIILAVFTAATAGQTTTEELWDDYKGVKERVDSWTISDFAKSFEPHVKYFFLSASIHVFGNIRAIPFIASIVLLALTYFFTKEITQNRFAGIVATLLLVQSNVFLSYDTTSTYDNFWILLYLFSLYLIYKKWLPSPVSYLLSIFAKPLTIAYMPMSLFFIARSDISRKAKLYSLGLYGIIIIIMVAAALGLKTNLTGTGIGFDSANFWNGFSAMALQMRFDYIILIFLVPLTVMLFFASRKGVVHADSIMIFILIILLSAPFLTGFTEQTNQPYRLVSLSVFFAIGVGVLLSGRTSAAAELSSK